MNRPTVGWLAAGCLALCGVGPRAGAAERAVLISNCLREAPNGVAWVVRDRAAFVFNPEAGYNGKRYRPGPAAPDDRYHLCRFQHDAAQVEFAWGRVGDSLVGRFSTDRAVELDLRLSSGWPDWTSTFEPTPDGALGRAVLDGAEVVWRLRCSPAPRASSATAVTLALSPGQPLDLVAGLGEPPPLGLVETTLATARAQYWETRPQAAGDSGDFVGAIADNLNNSRFYASDNRRWAHAVSRGWFRSPNTQPYFCWDSFFNANLAALDDPAGAQATVRAILSCQTAEGCVPNYGHWDHGVQGVSIDRSQPPVGAWCVWKMHQRYPAELEFLAEVYPRLLRWHDWWPRFRDAHHTGLLSWGSETGKFQAAQYETGWDDNLHFAGARMVGRTMDCYAVDLCALWAMDAHYLALLADVLGNAGDARRLRADESGMRERLNEFLWNPELRQYCSRLWSADGPGRFLTRVTPMNFYPLSAGAPDAERARDVLGLLTAPGKFWGTWLLPTLAYDDPDWHRQDYWRGKVWPPVNYIVCDGLKRYATAAQLREFGERGVELFMSNWTRAGVCGENYLSTTGAQSSDPHYTWGALLCLIGLESLVDVDDSGQLVLNGAQTRTLVLRNIPLLGARYDVRTAPGEAVLLRGGHVVLTARGALARVRP